jgi:hypothetical protein
MHLVQPYSASMNTFSLEEKDLQRLNRDALIQTLNKSKSTTSSREEGLKVTCRLYPDPGNGHVPESVPESSLVPEVVSWWQSALYA